MDSQQFLDDELLERRIEKFYGYGNYEGKYWFIGMEERGGEDFDDISCRINTWANRGQQEIDDVAEYHQDMGVWGKNNQPTWNNLIRILLSAKGKENIRLQDVHDYQFEKLCRKNQETCLLELLPLASPDSKSWKYSQYSKLIFLSSRRLYQKHCIHQRINHISRRIQQYKPPIVILYGFKNYQYLIEIIKKITDIEVEKINFSEKEYFWKCKNSHTVFVISQHPTAHGATNEYFHYIGKSIAAQLA